MNLNLSITVHPSPIPGALPKVEVASPAIAPAARAGQEPFTKLGADGLVLADAASGHVAFRHNATGKLFHFVASEKVLQSEAEKKAAAVTLFGRPWQLADVDELELLRDRTRWDPACHPILAGDIKSDWYWSRTPDASDPSGCAWLVSFDFGSSFIGYRGYGRGFVVAVAPAGQ